jgi:hypothetical protein
MSAWRRLNNRIDRWLDRRSLHAPVESVQVLGVGGVPCLASVAIERAAQQAQALDRDARLKQVLAPQGTQPDGAASRWQFHFELPRARARLAVDWYLDGDVRGGRFGHETIAVRAEPFPPSESVLAQGVAEGKVRYARLGRVWKEERRRTPDLPMAFRESDVAVADLARRGLALDGTGFTLGVAAEAGGALVWVARTGTAVYRCPFR